MQKKRPKSRAKNHRLTGSAAKISALASAGRNFNTRWASAKAFNDRCDLQSFNAPKRQTTAFLVHTGASAEPGSHSVTVSSVAREQRTNLSQ